MRFLELAGLVSGTGSGDSGSPELTGHRKLLASRAVAISGTKTGANRGSYTLAVGTADRVQAVRRCALALCRDIIFIFGLFLCVLGSRDRAQVARQAGMASTQPTELSHLCGKF